MFLLENNLIKTIDESWVYKNEGLCQLPYIFKMQDMDIICTK